MLEKDREDFTNILRGKTMSDADPKIAEHAQAFRDSLLLLQEPNPLPPLRLPEQREKETATLIWPKIAYATIIILVVSVPLLVSQVDRLIYHGKPIEPLEEPIYQPPINKAFPFVLELSLTNPEAEATQFSKELQKFKMEFISTKVGTDIWQIEVQCDNSSQRQQLDELLAHYDESFPADDNRVAVRFKRDETQTTP